MKASDRQYIKTVEQIREQKLEEHGYWFCDKCLSNNAYHCSMHHIVYRSEKPKHEHLHDERNLIDCCEICHLWFHEKKDRRNYLIEQRNLTELFGNDIL